MVQSPLSVGVAGGCLDDVRPWPGRDGDQKGGEVARRERRCSSRDSVFMQMLLLWEEGKGSQAELAPRAPGCVHQGCCSLRAKHLRSTRDVSQGQEHVVYRSAFQHSHLPTGTWAPGLSSLPGLGHPTAGSDHLADPSRSRRCLKVLQ